MGHVGSILYYLFLESNIEEFMRYWRANWPNESIPPKIHFLEDHIVEFIKKWKVGLGFYGEQGKKNYCKYIFTLSFCYHMVLFFISQIAFTFRRRKYPP